MAKYKETVGGCRTYQVALQLESVKSRQIWPKIWNILNKKQLRITKKMKFYPYRYLRSCTWAFTAHSFRHCFSLPFCHFVSCRHNKLRVLNFPISVLGSSSPRPVAPHQARSFLRRCGWRLHLARFVFVLHLGLDYDNKLSVLDLYASDCSFGVSPPLWSCSPQNWVFLIVTIPPTRFVFVIQLDLVCHNKRGFLDRRVFTCSFCV